MDYLSHWKLTEKPFEDLPNAKFYYESNDHKEALDRLQYIVHDRNMGIGLLTGEIGSGKTTTRKVLERNLSAHEFEVVAMDSAGFEFNDLLYDVLTHVRFQHVGYETGDQALKDRRHDKYYLVDMLRNYLQHLNEVEKRHLVVMIDEAQQLTEDTLDNIKNMTNLKTDTQSYLTLLLIGQPELRETIRKLKQLDQRVSLRFHLNNLDLGETEKYVHHRLRVAGCPRETLFSHESVATLFRGTKGVPREINRVCKLALDHGASSSMKEIDAAVVELILQDIERHR